MLEYDPERVIVYLAVVILLTMYLLFLLACKWIQGGNITQVLQIVLFAHSWHSLSLSTVELITSQPVKLLLDHRLVRNWVISLFCLKGCFGHVLPVFETFILIIISNHVKRWGLCFFIISVFIVYDLSYAHLTFCKITLSER